VICNYPYILDTSANQTIKNNLKDKGNILIIDEAHNIDEICVEQYTI